MLEWVFLVTQDTADDTRGNTEQYAGNQRREKPASLEFGVICHQQQDHRVDDKNKEANETMVSGRVKKINIGSSTALASPKTAPAIKKSPTLALDK